jgi:hypothetical protein
VLLLIDSPLLARHFEAEMDRLWRGAELGITARLRRKLERQRRSCGSGSGSGKIVSSATTATATTTGPAGTRSTIESRHP